MSKYSFKLYENSNHAWTNTLKKQISDNSAVVFFQFDQGFSLQISSQGYMALCHHQTINQFWGLSVSGVDLYSIVNPKLAFLVAFTILTIL